MISRRLDFAAVASTALSRARILVPEWLPAGKLKGHEWLSINPTRGDRNSGSFSVNLDNGKWADFATGDRGGDLISLAAYLRGVTQGRAARELARELGVDRD